MPKVSVVCPVYKHEAYLRQCFDGFVTQKTNFPIEILVNDDCSPDNSATIIHEYEEKYPELFRCIYQNENQYSKGIKPEWDILFPIAKGDYIALCEGDDYWIDPYKLQKQVDFMEKHPDYVACFHNARVQSKDDVTLFNPLNENHYPSTEDLILRRWFISTPTLLFRNVLKEYPDWRGKVSNGDYLLELLLAKEGKFYYMDDVMAVYRQEGQGVSVMLDAHRADLYDKLVFILSSVKEMYPDKYAAAFDKSIANYKKMKDDHQKELYYDSHPFLKAFRPKTYKRMIKKWMIKLLK